MAAALLSPRRIKGNRRRLRRPTSGRTVYAYVGGNPISFIDPFGLERFPGYCDALRYIDRFGSPDEALGPIQEARRSLGQGGSDDWEARTPLGDRLRNAENYMAAYVSVEAGERVGSALTAISLFWATPAYHGANAAFNLRPHSPASSTAVRATWSGLGDGYRGEVLPDPDCGCK